jgi:alpha-beta hydrolase superfamily lysophospholipase
VLLFHGYGAEKSSLVNEAKVFLGLGCSVMLVDFRGSGESSEAYTTVGYHEGLDVAAAVQYAQTNLPRARLVLYGQSMGAAAILRAVYASGVKPDAVILEAVFDSLLHTAQNRFHLMKIPAFPNAQLLLFWGGWQAGFNPFNHNPVTYASRVSCPALFLHARNDPRARLEDARAVFAAVPAPKEFREFPDLGHASTLARYPAQWRQTVQKFLEDHKLVPARAIVLDLKRCEGLRCSVGSTKPAEAMAGL